jgi:hypothetical protein
MRFLLVTGLIFALLAGLGVGAYFKYFRSDPTPEVQPLEDKGEKLSTQEEFDKLAREDPVKMLAEAVTRYQREGHKSAHFTLEKQERVKGAPKPPAMPPVELIDTWVSGDVPDHETKKTAIEVVMKWKQGAKKVLGAEIRGTLFSERPGAKDEGKVVSWRPDAWVKKLGPPMAPNSEAAKDQSRYCIRDAGLYRSMLRTHDAWKARQEAGEFKFEYLGKKPIEALSGRECHIIKRICPRVEVDSFEIGGATNLDPKVVAVEGFTEVTLFIDAERWLQLGSELYRTEPDGTRVLVGVYHFRDVQLDQPIPPDTFTDDGLMK